MGLVVTIFVKFQLELSPEPQNGDDLTDLSQYVVVTSITRLIKTVISFVREWKNSTCRTPNPCEGCTLHLLVSHELWIKIRPWTKAHLTMFENIHKALAVAEKI